MPWNLMLSLKKNFFKAWLIAGLASCSSEGKPWSSSVFPSPPTTTTSGFTSTISKSSTTHDIEVCLPCLPDLIKTKEWAMRAKDIGDIQLLEALRRNQAL